MLLPLGDSPNPRSVPYMTYALLLANIAVFVLVAVPLSAAAPAPGDPLLQQYVDAILHALPQEAMRTHVESSITAYDLFVFEHGFRPAAPELGTLFSSMFLHAGLPHLLGNLLFLWIYGDNVEYRLGPVAFLGAYLGTGVAATLFHAVADPGGTLPLIGASGAISGVLGFYFVWFPRNRVRLFLMLPPLLFRSLFVPARIVLAIYLVIDNLLPFLLERGLGGGGVAHGAHIGGFVAGLATAWAIDRREVAARPHEFAGGAVNAAGAAAEIRAALAQNAFERAARIYFALPAPATRGLLTPADSLALATCLRAAGHPHAALAVFRRHVRDRPNGPGLAEAHLGAGLVQLEDFDQPTPAYQHFLAALDSNPAPETVREARRALAAIEARRKRSRFGGAFGPRRH